MTAADQHHHPDDELLAALGEQYDAVPDEPITVTEALKRALQLLLDDPELWGAADDARPSAAREED